MIQLNGKTQTLLFPKNKDSWGPYTLVFHSELSQRNYTYENLSDEGSRGYLTFTINSSNIAPGEYNYSIYDYEDEEVGIGLAVCDIEESNPMVKYYEISATIKEYVPKFRPVEPMKLFLPEGFIAYTATTIPYRMASALPWAMTVYLNGRQVGETLWGESGTTEGVIEITPNLTNENRTYEIYYGDEEGEYSFSTTKMQEGLPFSVSISTPDEIPASGTEISYTVEYSQRNTIRTAEVYLYRNEELIQQSHFGMYPYGFSSYFQVPANTTRDEITYRIEVKTNKTPIYESVSASSTCVQLVDEYKFTRFTIEMLEDGDITWDGVQIYYAKNGDPGYQLDHQILDLEAGDIIEFYVEQDQPNTSYKDKYIISSGQFKVYGNIMSLLYVNYETATTLNIERQFQHLLSNNIWKLVDAGNLRLPATTLSDFCYLGMFGGCRNLLTVPSLPATNLANSCYAYMFSHTAIREAPELPATTLVSACYSNMFEGCTNLENAPELPATTLTLVCYNYMFGGCSNLHYVKCLATDISAISCTSGWLSGVSETGTFVKASGMNNWPTGNNGIPSDWTVQNE